MNIFNLIPKFVYDKILNMKNVDITELISF